MTDAPDGEARGGKISWAEGGNFAIIPEWILYAEVSDKAVRTFGVLARHASAGELRAYPSRKTMAGLVRCALSTLDAAIKELVALGAVTVEPQTREGRKVASNYYLHIINPESRASMTGQSGMGMPGESGMEELELDMNESEVLAIARTSPDRPTPPVVLEHNPASGKKNLNPPLDALVQECGIDNGNRARMRYAVTALNGKGNDDQGIRDLFWLEAQRWCDENDRADLLDELEADGHEFNRVLVNKIRQKAAKYRQSMDGARLTPTALQNWWLDVDLQRPSKGKASGMNPDDVAQWFRDNG